jgi:Pentapeptide repeats (8 copies)
LHVLPYLVPKNDHQHYVDPDQLLMKDQRQLWWEYYGRASGNGFTGLPPQLDRGNLNEITAQPLLNYLVALSLRSGQLEFSEATNLNAVYDNLLQSVYARGWDNKQHSAIQGVEEKDFVRILEEIALAAWHGNGRTTTVKAIESHCIHSGLKNLLDRFQENFQDNPQANVTRLLTAFYFRRSGSDNDGDKTFEFTHKSFGEYLTAKRIIREVRLIQKKLMARKSDPDEGWDEREALHRWVILCAMTTMDEYLFNFIMDEVHLQHQISATEVCEWQQTFCSLIGFMLCHGLPLERLSPRPSYQEEFRQAINAEDSLLALLGAFQNVTQEISNIDFPTSDAFGELLARLRGQRESTNNSMCFHCLSHLNLCDCNLIFQDLHGANLDGSNLSLANLNGSNLSLATAYSCQA